MKKNGLFLYSVIVVALLFMACGKRAEEEAFYIRDGYTGPIAIIFGQQNGADEAYNDGTRIYRIPESAVLYTQFLAVDGILNQKFYYTNEAGKIVAELPTLFMPVLPTAKYDSSRVYAMVGIDGRFGDQEYFYFGVGRALKSDSIRGEGYRLMERVREIYPKQLK